MNNVKQESDAEFHRRRAGEEREASQHAKTAAERSAHLDLAREHELAADEASSGVNRFMRFGIVASFD